MFYKPPLSILLFYYFIHQTSCDVINSKLSLYAKNGACRGMVLLSQYTYSTFTAHRVLACAFKCSVQDACASFHFEESSQSCHLNSQASSLDCSEMTTNKKAKHFDKISPVVCLNGGYIVNGTCKCVDGYVGKTCGRLMTDCSEGYNSGNDYGNAVYNIQPLANRTSFPVFCEMKAGGRTMVQYRRQGNENFNRNWTDYRDGFGSLDSDFWLGLEKMYQVIGNRNFELRAYMKLINGSYYQHRFLNFNIGDENSGYVMYFSTDVPYTVDPLGDSLSSLNGSKFSTPDVDNDNLTNGSCAQQFQSGFWFNACADCNPNGRLLKPADGKRTNVDSEVFWTFDLGDDVPIRTQFWLLAT